MDFNGFWDLLVPLELSCRCKKRQVSHGELLHEELGPLFDPTWSCTKRDPKDSKV